MLRSIQLSLVIASAFLVACPGPGKGAKAERGYHRAAPVIAAIDRYHAATGEYPPSLEALTPQYLDSLSLQRPENIQESTFEYHRLSDGFELSFRYVGPGMNTCTYRSSTKAWTCGGYF